MRLTEWTRQTRWAHAPLPAPPGVASGAVYVRELVWAICRACDLQVHGARAVVRREGMRCPECGGALTPPQEPAGPQAEAVVAADEARLTALLDAEGALG